MKLLAALAAAATLTVAAPALAEGENPVQNAIKDQNLMMTGRYALPGPVLPGYPYAAPRLNERRGGYVGSGFYDRPVAVYPGPSVGYRYGYADPVARERQRERSYDRYTTVTGDRYDEQFPPVAPYAPFGYYAD